MRRAWKGQLDRLRQPPGGEPRNRQFGLQQVDLFGQVTRVLQLLARSHPLLLILDDVQWADAGSVSLLFHLGRRLAGSRILVVAAYRPDTIAPPSPDGTRHPLETVVTEIQRVSGDRPIDLDQCEGRHFVEALLDAEPNRLSAAFREQLVRHTEGHPLFTVELLRSLQESGGLVRDAEGRWVEGAALHWEKVPARVEAVIAERIGRLPDRCRALLAAASVEGEEFTAEAMARVLDVDASAIVQCLSGELSERHRLVTAVSLRRLGARRLSRYRFRHTLFRQYLYDHLDAVRRAHWHEAIGNALEQMVGDAPDDLEALAPRLAWHFESAGLADRAAQYIFRPAGGAAGSQRRGHRPPDPRPGPARSVVRNARAGPAQAGPAACRTIPVRFRARLPGAGVGPRPGTCLRLSQHPMLAGSPQRGLALAAVAFFATWTGEPDRARQAGEQFLRMAELNPYPQQLELAHLVLGAACFLRGDFVPAHEHLKQALINYDFRSLIPWICSSASTWG